MSPPSTIPIPPPTPSTDDNRPMLPATRSRGNSSRTIPNASGKMPPPAPWMMRPAIIGVSEVDSAETTVPTARMTNVMSSSFSLPYISPRRPRIDVATDADSR